MVKKIFNISPQVADEVIIGDPCNPSSSTSALTINSSDRGVLLPRLTDVEMNSIVNPDRSLLIYNVTHDSFFYYNGFSWIDVGSNGNLIGPTGPVGLIGPTGPTGLNGVSGSLTSTIFITDVTSLSGIVGMKTYKPGIVPSNAVLMSAISDTQNVRIHIGSNGGSLKYSPDVSVNGNNVSLTETSTKRWFSGYVDLTLVEGINIITATTLDGSTDVAEIIYVIGGPSVQSVTFGNFPGTQTTLKSGDQIGVTINTDLNAVFVTISNSGASSSNLTLPVVNGIASGTITISDRVGNLPITVTAKNQLGTSGTSFVSTNLPLDQVYPSISSIVINYPTGKQAFNSNDVGSLSSSVTSFDTILYSSYSFTIESSSLYNQLKNITNISSGYIDSGTNISITATKLSNNSSTTVATLAKVATVPPTAYITLVGGTRLIGSPTGVVHEIRVYPDQQLSTNPTLIASAGLIGSTWIFMSGYWKNTLTIYDSTPKGTAQFTNLVLIGLSGIEGNFITSGNTYYVGGFTSRIVTFPAFSRVADMGVSVDDQTKTVAQLIGGNILTLHTDSGIYQNGYYFANSDGSYNLHGSYLGLSDSSFAGSNTTGTLQASIVENQ